MRQFRAGTGLSFHITSAVKHKIALLTLAATLATAPLCASAVHHSGAHHHAKQAHPTKAKLKGIPRFGEVTPTLYRGGRPTPKALKTLSELGVNLVIDLRGTDKKERRRANKLGMRYVAIPWHCPFPKDKDFVKFLTLLRENQDKKVFVHCRLGDDRTGMMIASYRMAVQGWTAAEAAREMRAYGFSPLHHMICPGLAGYEASFPERLKKDPALRALRSTQTARR